MDMAMVIAGTVALIGGAWIVFWAIGFGARAWKAFRKAPWESEPGVAVADDLRFGSDFINSCRYASWIVVVGVDPDRPDEARVRSFPRDAVGPDLPYRELVDPEDIADCLRTHADDIEAKGSVL